MKRQVFISHGEKKPWVRKLRERLRSELDRNDFKPLLDEALLQAAAGERWPRILHKWVCSCHGAVILLDSRAKDSHWVQAEACWLHLRASRDGLFVLPVGCGITFDELPPILQETAGLREDQWLTADKADVGGTVDRILERLREKVPEPRDMSDPWTTFVMDAVALVRSATKEGGRSDAQRVAQALDKGEQFQEWSPEMPWAALVVNWLFAETDLERCARAIRRLTMSGEMELKLLDLVVKAGFDEEPLEDLRSILAHPKQVFALHPNASVLDDAKPTRWQLQRPFPSYKEPTCLPVPYKNSDAGDNPAGVSVILQDLQLAADAHARITADTDPRTKEAKRRAWAKRKMTFPTVFHVPVDGSDSLDIDQVKNIIGQASCCIVSYDEQTGLPCVGSDSPEEWAIARNVDYQAALEALK